jgi:hypothetical protein
MSSPHQGRPTFQVCAFKFAIFLLLNIVELGPYSALFFIPPFSLVLSITVGVKFLGHASIVFFFLSVSRP